jgi:hypothetical protein
MLVKIMDSIKNAFRTIALLLVCGSLSLVVRHASAQTVIDSLNIDETKGQLELWGTFGLDNAVFMQYTPLTVLQSSKNYLVCSLPDAGPGSCGELVVYADQIPSQPRMITQWAFEESHILWHTFSDGGYDILWDTLIVRFRADLVQLSRQHRIGDFQILSEEDCYDRNFAGGHKGIRGGGLNYGTHDSTTRGSFPVFLNLWNQTISVGGPVTPTFNPDFSMSPILPAPPGLENQSALPIDGDSIAHFLPNDSILWDELYGPTLIGPKCSIQLQDQIGSTWALDSIDYLSATVRTLDTGSTLLSCSLDWNTTSSSHFIRSARWYTILDTLQSPSPHVESIRVLMADSSKSISELYLRYFSLLQFSSDTFNVDISTYLEPLIANSLGLQATNDTTNWNQPVIAVYHHSKFLSKSSALAIFTDTLSTGHTGTPHLSITFFNASESVPILHVQSPERQPGYLLKDKFDYLKQSGVEELIDVLGRRISIKDLSSPASLQRAIYFARLNNGVVMKLMNF